MAADKSSQLRGFFYLLKFLGIGAIVIVGAGALIYSLIASLATAPAWVLAILLIYFWTKDKNCKRSGG